MNMERWVIYAIACLILLVAAFNIAYNLPGEGLHFLKLVGATGAAGRD